MLIASAFPIDDGKNKAPSGWELHSRTSVQTIGSDGPEASGAALAHGTSGFHDQIPSNRLVPKIVLQHAEIDVLVGQRVAAAVPQHVGPNLGEPGTDAGGRRCD